MKAFEKLTKKQKTIGLIALGLVLIFAFFYNSEFLRPEDRSADSNKVEQLKEKENEDLTSITQVQNPELPEEDVLNGFSITSDVDTISPGGQVTLTGVFDGTGDFDRTISWSLVEPHSENSSVSPEGVLTVGADETNSQIIVQATAAGGQFYASRVITIDQSNNALANPQPAPPPASNSRPKNTQELRAQAQREQAQVTPQERKKREEEDRKIKQQAIAESNKGEKDKYHTSPVPEGKPKPVEPGTQPISSDLSTCKLSIRCDTILNNMDRFNMDKIDVLPPDGVILAMVEVQYHPGESVYDVLTREMRDRKIHMEASFTPAYNSAYVEGIHNLYEFDCGELSGWMYKVNGWFPNYGCSRYLVQPGDVIEWVYTCDLGRDVGDNSMAK